jgi:hypothetical protein
VQDVAESHAERIAAIYRAVVLSTRLERYAGRLADAWRRVRLGDHAALAEPGEDAYFGVWAEFRKDVDTLVRVPEPRRAC